MCKQHAGTTKRRAKGSKAKYGRPGRRNEITPVVIFEVGFWVYEECLGLNQPEYIKQYQNESPLRSSRIFRPSNTTKPTSNNNANATATLIRRRVHTLAPLMSFQAPRAANPAKAATPMTALISMPVCRGHTLSRTVNTTNVIPSRKYEMEMRDNRKRIEALRGTRFATTTEVISEGVSAGWGC